MLFAVKSSKANYGDPSQLVERLLNENALERARSGLTTFDPEGAEAALRTLVEGPRPDHPLDRLHALVLHGVIEVLCSHIGDDAFGPTTFATLADIGGHWRPVLGDAFAESLSTRRLPFVLFADDVVSPNFSYWMNGEMKSFLDRLPEAIKKAGGDTDTLQMLHRLRETWTDAVGQGPDAILVRLL